MSAYKTIRPASIVLLAYLLCFAFNTKVNAESASFYSQLKHALHTEKDPLDNPDRTKIVFWHTMAGALNHTLQEQVGTYNRSQNKYFVEAIYKGNYTTALTSAAAAYRAGNQPAILLSFEVGTATMLYSGGAVKPLYRALRETKSSLPISDIIPTVRSYYSTPKGRLAALPYNTSSTVMFYNKDAFKKAGLDPNSPPKTWQALAEVSRKLLKAGYSCGFTSTWPSWVLLEQFSAWNNIPFASQNNGFSSLDARLTYDNAQVTDFFEKLKTWQSQRLFKYGGRGDTAMSLFISQTCPVMFQSSGGLANIKANANFELGTAMMPYLANHKGSPQNTIIGGGALWILNGHTKPVYKGIVDFYRFLLQPETQTKWAMDTGYLPVTRSGYKQMKRSGYYEKHPGAEIAIKQLNYKLPNNYTRGIRLGNYPLIRIVNDNYIEQIFSGQKTPKKALQSAVNEGNDLIQRFIKENRAR